MLWVIEFWSWRGLHVLPHVTVRLLLPHHTLPTRYPLIRMFVSLHLSSRLPVCCALFMPLRRIGCTCAVCFSLIFLLLRHQRSYIFGLVQVDCFGEKVAIGPAYEDFWKTTLLYMICVDWLVFWGWCNPMILFWCMMYCKTCKTILWSWLMKAQWQRSHYMLCWVIYFML